MGNYNIIIILGLMVGSMLSDSKNASGIIPLVLMPLIAFSGFFAN